MKKLIDSKGWLVINRLGIFTEMFYILRENYNDLISELDSIQNLPELDAAIKTFENKNLSRMLFNFLSSASALVDYTRNTLRFYKGSDLEQKYVVKVKDTFKENCYAVFIKDFRNYQVHYATYMPYMSDTQEIVILTEELLKYKKWTALSKQFIKNCGEYVNLKMTCVKYFNSIEIFYSWLYSEFLKWHHNDLIETSNLINRVNNPQLSNFYNSIIRNQNINLKE